jgi:hypothetical protein
MPIKSKRNDDQKLKLFTLFQSHFVFIKIIDSCANDFVEISDTTSTFRLCSNEYRSLKDKFCSNTIYVSYRANSSVTSFTSYRGFKLYYESNYILIIYEMEYLWQLFNWFHYNKLYIICRIYVYINIKIERCWYTLISNIKRLKRFQEKGDF